MKTVKLSFLADQLEEAFEDWSQFYNVETGEVESIPNQDNAYADFEEFEEIAGKIEASDDYLRLPDQYEIHEYEIMEAFAEEKESKRLLRALQGRGAFRRFKDCCMDLGLDEEYYAFRHEALKQIAKEWCEDNDIPFEP